MKRKLHIESLESRRLFASIPFGATPEDTGEFMLGRVGVTVVLLESNGQIDPSTEDWTITHRNEVMNKIEEGLNWWPQLLAKQNTKHDLEFIIDRKFVDTAFSTAYEPISRRSDDYSLWVNEFLNAQGFGGQSLLDANMRAFNQSQRLKLNTDWAFTIFVAHSTSDQDGKFAEGGSFDQAFSFAGGLFEVVPSTRPASTFAHETGHMFWALDEYQGSASYYRQRGYYNTQNTNSLVANPNPNFSQQDSIMSDGVSLQRAYENKTSPASTLAMIGWKDSDGDGIFDLLDVPIQLDVLGVYDPFTSMYRWNGTATVGTLPNVNSSGNQSSITLNKIDRIEARIGLGVWQALATPASPTVIVDLKLPIAISDLGKTIELRAVNIQTGITSNAYSATIGTTPSQSKTTGVYGFIWNDLNQDGLWGDLESDLAGQQVKLESLAGTPPVGQVVTNASNSPIGPITSLLNGMSISSVGSEADGRVGIQLDPDSDLKIFHPYRLVNPLAPTTFDGRGTMLRLGFPNSTRRIDVSIRAASENAIARIDAFATDGTILARYESPSLQVGEDATVSVESSAPIAYAVVYGHLDSRIQVTQVLHGIPDTVVTDTKGLFHFPNLPSGSYRITATPSSQQYVVLGSSNRVLNLAASSGQSLRADYGFYRNISPWTNTTNPFDVNDDGRINGVDIITVIDIINQRGSGRLNTKGISPKPYVDINDDGLLSPLDALGAIDYFNELLSSNKPSGQSGEGESFSKIANNATPLDYDPTITKSNRWKSQI